MTPGLVVLIVFVVGAVVLWEVMSAKRKWSQDRRIAGSLENNLKDFLVKRSVPMSESPDGIGRFAGLRLGEVTRHFDSNTLATISGWLNHDLGFHGWGLAGAVGALGLGIGKMGLSGTSQVHLTSAGTTRDDLMSEGLVAVFEYDTPKGVDTLRVVVPSQKATKEFVDSLLEGLLQRFTKLDGKGQRVIDDDLAFSYTALRKYIPSISDYRNETSYVSDRLHSVLRMPEGSRPTITVYGQELSGHAILGAGLQISGDADLYPLFPVSLVKTVPHLVDLAVLTKSLPAPAAARFCSKCGTQLQGEEKFCAQCGTSTSPSA